MELSDFLYVSFDKIRSPKEIHKWLEYLSLNLPSDIRLPYDSSKGMLLTTKGVALDFECCSPESGPYVGYMFRPSFRNGKLSKSETAALRKIKSLTREYENQKPNAYRM